MVRRHGAAPQAGGTGVAAVTGLSAFPVRLLPGDDLKEALDRLVREREIAAGCIVACAGSLTRASLRLAGAAEATILGGPLEIVSLTGTLSPDGSHLHLAVADREGKVSGGHVKEGCRVQTTAEIVVGTLRGARFGRKLDPATGFRELQILTDCREERHDQGE